MKELNFSLTLVDFLSKNIALKTLEKAVKIDAQLKGKPATYIERYVRVGKENKFSNLVTCGTRIE